MYEFSPTPAQQALREELTAFVQEALLADSRPGTNQAFDRTRWARCGQLLLPGLAIPEAYGGRGLGALDTLLALETLGYAHPDNGLNFSLSAHLLACVVPLWLFGSEDLKRRYLPGLCNGEWIAANAMSEPSSGSDAFQMATTATPGAEGYTIDGSKSFVSNGPVSDMVLLYAATDPGRGFLGGISAFWLDRRIHPYQSSPPLEKAGLPGSSLGSLFFSQLQVEKAYQVGPEGRGAHLFNKSMEWERVCLGAGHVGNLQRLLEAAIALVRAQIGVSHTREQRQAVSHELADIHTRLEAVRLQAYAAAWKMDQGRAVSREAAMVKMSISELYKSATLRIAQLFQASGTYNADAEQSHLDALSSTIYSGTTEMQKTIIAQSLGL